MAPVSMGYGLLRPEVPAGRDEKGPREWGSRGPWILVLPAQGAGGAAGAAGAAGEVVRLTAVRLTAVRFAGARLAVVRLAAAAGAARLAVVRLTAVRFAGARLAVVRLTAARLAGARLAVVRLARRSAWQWSASQSSAWPRSAWPRSAWRWCAWPWCAWRGALGRAPLRGRPLGGGGSALGGAPLGGALGRSSSRRCRATPGGGPLGATSAHCGGNLSQCPAELAVDALHRLLEPGEPLLEFTNRQRLHQALHGPQEIAAGTCAPCRGPGAAGRAFDSTRRAAAFASSGPGHRLRASVVRQGE